ncbi:MAG: AMP-dependent synthetase [Alphaproteobacteria bacterium]|nr:MAG: AMP-dependent synthetase [Alphaproteobacteria bacterium]
MAELIRRFAEEKGAAPALVDDFRTRSWSEFNERVNQLMHGLQAQGLEIGAKIGLLCSNRAEYFEVLAATGHGSWFVVPINWHFVADEIAFIVEDSGADVLAVDGRFEEEARKAVKMIKGLKLVLLIDGTPGDGFEDYEAFLAAQSKDEPETQGMGSVMFYTSGTTGRPKGVRGSAASNVGESMEVADFVLQVMADTVGVPRGGCALLCGPAYHSAQWAFSYMPLMVGSTVVMQHKFDPEATLGLIDQYQVTNSHMVPTQFVRFLKYRQGAEDVHFDGSSLKIIWHGAAPCSPAIKKDMIEWWGPIFTEYYGGTEGGFATLIDSEDWLAHPGSVGKATASNEIMIVDDEGNPCPPGQPGTIYQRSLVGSDFEYHNRPDETEKRHLEPGVFTLGDVGFLDKDGYLFLTDRKIDMIISGGVNIYPAEIESVLVTHPRVHDVAVFGVPNEEFGEEIKAVVELVGGGAGDDALVDDLKGFAAEHLAKYKVPRSWDFSDELPRTPAGKLLKRLLRDPYWEGKTRSI